MFSNHQVPGTEKDWTELCGSLVWHSSITLIFFHVLKTNNTLAIISHTLLLYIIETTVLL